MSVLKSGSEGSGVILLQSALNQWMSHSDYGLAFLDEDGNFGPATKEAVELFQTIANNVVSEGNDESGQLEELDVDGKVGPKTLAALSTIVLELTGNYLDPAEVFVA